LESPGNTVKKQAELLNLNRSSLYYRPVPPSPEEIAIKHRIDEIYTEYPFYKRRILDQPQNRSALHAGNGLSSHLS